MRVANMVPEMEYNLEQSQQALSTALQQVTTGLRVNQPSDDPTAAANDTISLAASADVDQYTKNITTITSQMQTADSAFSSIVGSLNSAITLGTSGAGSNVSTANKATIAADLVTIINSVVANGNVSYQGIYQFAGSASNTPPLVAANVSYTSTLGSNASPLSASTPLMDGSITSVSDASTGQTLTFTAGASDTIGTLETAIANAATAGTLSSGTAASITYKHQLSVSSNNGADGIVVSTNDPALGAMTADAGSSVPNSYAYIGNGDVNSVAVGDSTSVATNVAGDKLFDAGANVLGVLTGLITALQSGTITDIQNATTAITTSLDNFTEQRVPLDNSISQLSSQESFLSQETITLSTQQTALTGINLAESATNLAQAETDNSAVLAAAAKVLPQTLLSYLSQG